VPEIKVMTWNMLHAPGDRLEDLFAVLAAEDPDVVCAQEIDSLEGAAELAARLGMTLFVGTSNRPESPPPAGEPAAPENLAVLSRLPIRRVAVHAGDREAMFRPVLEAWLMAPDAAFPVGLFTVHLRAAAGPEGSAYKQREAAALRTVLADASGAHIVLGDFNAWAPGHAEAWGLPADYRSDMPADYRRAVGGEVLGGLLEEGYVDILEGRTGSPPAPSMRGPGRPRVDHVLVTPDLSACVREAAILRNERIEVASDHHPIVVRLELPAGRAASRAQSEAAAG
jgi:endonuclease/exonuclease/phosphatase family metal-dependent hydrolase